MTLGLLTADSEFLRFDFPALWGEVQEALLVHARDSEISVPLFTTAVFSTKRVADLWEVAAF